MMDHYVERVVDLTDPAQNQILNMSVDAARALLLTGPAAELRKIQGSFALVAQNGKHVRLARSLDRPLRYFLAKRQEGPALVVSHRIDDIRRWLESEGFGDQFHPHYTRMVPAHHVVDLQLIGCPDPDPVYTRFFTPERNAGSGDIEEMGGRYIGALAQEIADWLPTVPEAAPIGVSFSGGIDSGAVFLAAYHVMRKLGMNLARLKAFTLSLGEGSDLTQSREFLGRCGLGLFHEPVEASADWLDVNKTIEVIEDYKILDVEAATMVMALCRGIRERYPQWRYLLDGDGGDENLKDYPIEENPELTIRSVVHNRMLYQEGWGVGTIKHSLTYSGGLSRSYTRTFGPLRHWGFSGFSPFTRPSVIEVAEGIPFISLTQYDVPTLYSLKGRIVSAGVKSVTGIDMPVFEKCRFQHGAASSAQLRARVPAREAELRRKFLALHA